ncbi:hypothetical protein A0256_22610 [Mucilaginibacter sp. PAMC 26640]|nr:hypothetical protein A0256_22610 [Mucilaginibacter sp. PAMC 26640]
MRYNGKVLAMVIRMRRLDLNYSQDYIAGKLGMSQNAYSKLELGHTGITIGKFLVICQALELHPGELIGLYTDRLHLPGE